MKGHIAPIAIGRGVTDSVLGLLGVACVTLLTAIGYVHVGPAAALLYLLPVLFVAVRGNSSAGLLTAAGAALSYNFFLLEPRYTFRVDHVSDIIGFLSLFLVAIVTSRMASNLREREREAVQRARDLAEQAQFADAIGECESMGQLNSTAAQFLERLYAPAMLLESADDPARQGLNLLEQSAANWCRNNSCATGHGTAIMAAADNTYLALEPDAPTALVAISKPIPDARHPVRSTREIAQLAALVRLFGQARDRLALRMERAQRSRLEERDSLRSTILASMGHDFRTPLTVLWSGLEALDCDRAQVANLKAQVLRLQHMTSDLIGAARLDSGAIVPSYEPVDLADVVAGALDDCAVMLQSLQPRVELPDDLPLIKADPILLHHMLINLLENASRYCDTELSVVAKSILSGNDQAVTLSVLDDGPGLPEGSEESIFERFVRLDGTDRDGGSGLGLSIVRGFASAMGMQVRASNRADRSGTEFQLLLPALPDRHWP